MNRYNVTNINQVINNYHNVTYIKNVQVNKYINIQRAATVVPARAMVSRARCGRRLCACSLPSWPVRSRWWRASPSARRCRRSA